MDDDSKEIWEAIKLGFGGNANSKKLQKAVFQCNTHGAEVSTEDANHKFLRSLPPAWSNLAMTMRTNPEINNLSIDDLYNNLRVFEQEIQDWKIVELKSGQSIGNYIDSISNEEFSLRKQEGEFAPYGKNACGFEQKEALIVSMSQHCCIETIAQLVTSQKQQLSLNEKLAFQANEIHEKDEKLKRYRRIGMKAVKEKEQLQKTVDSWKDSSKNLWRLINSGMSSNDKLGLGFEIQSNDEVLSYEEEMNFSVFKCSKEDSIGKPSYSRFTKTNDFKGVPHPLSGDYTPKPQEEIDDSLYVYGKKGPQKPEISVSDENSSEQSTCQSNDNEG
ncbi:hypothetical protein Tco_0610025 [Tanacetum coccineum]